MNILETLEEKTVGQIVAERPSRARVFERFGLDYCCGGGKLLAQDCLEKQIDSSAVLQELMNADLPTSDETDWMAASLTSLADHIEQTHHAYLKAELPRLDRLTLKVVTGHGAKHPELAEVREVFVALKAEMEVHMAKEEQVFFPACRALEQGSSLPATALANPINVLLHEHDDAGRALARLRELTHGYTPPANVCATYRTMLDALQQLEADMHQHVHKENNILFPKAAHLAG